MSEIETSKPRPTHILLVNFANGQSSSIPWSETRDIKEVDGALVEGAPIDRYEEDKETIRVIYGNGGEVWFNKMHIVGFQRLPYKELSPMVRAELEAAKERPSARDNVQPFPKGGRHH